MGNMTDCNDPPVDKKGEIDPFTATPASQTKKGPPPPSGAVNLTGKWTLTSIDGDMDKFLDGMGAGFMMKSVASAANYGVGRAVHNITHDGNSFECKIESPIKSTTITFVIGNGSQKVEMPDGVVDATPSWVDKGKGVEMKTDKVIIKRTRPSENEYWSENTVVSTGQKVVQKFTK